MNNMRNKILSLLVLLLTAASGAWAQRLYLDVNGTAATLKYSANEADYSGKPSFTGATWATVGSIKTTVETITVDASCANFAGTSLKSMFNSFKTLKTVTGRGNINATNVTTTMNMFMNCWALTSVDLSGLNTSSVTTMECMFEGCKVLTTVRGLNTAGVSILSKMFWNCSALTTLDLSVFNTSSVTTMQNMFYGCSSLTTLNLSSFNTANVTSMANMFNGCSSLTSLDLRSFNTANVTSMFAMFQNCSALKEIIVGDGWSTEAVTSSSIMFKDCTSLPCYNASRVDKTKANTGYSGFMTLAGTFKVYTDAEASATTFTEAEFNMPDYDATVEFDIVRDMAVQMTAQVGDGTVAQPRYRVKKDGNNWIPAEMEITAVPALISVTDEIENNKVLTPTTDYFCLIYKLNEQGQPDGDGVEFPDFDFAPGLYAVKAVAADGSDYYVDTTALSNTFKLYYGYEVAVPAKEYVTYFKDEPLYADPETSAAAKLYTISSVSDDKATLSSAIETAPSNTPLLVYNPTDKAETFLLIPADAEPNLALTVYGGFKGKTTADVIPASTANQANYALNGKQFVWVMTELPIAANKCWLAVTASSARAITLTFEGETTGVGHTEITEITEKAGGVYDLSGRRVAKPAKKGVYVKDGKKVIIK